MCSNYFFCLHCVCVKFTAMAERLKEQISFEIFFTEKNRKTAKTTS